jgi:flagellar basal-body rod protein FlgB
VERIPEGAIPTLEASLRFRIARQAVLAANVAHADTPGYRRHDLEFEGRLAAAASRLERTHAAHLGASGATDYRLERGPRGTRPDGNGVELEQELVQLSRNAGSFQEQAAVLSRLLLLRRMAVTGEAR